MIEQLEALKEQMSACQSCDLFRTRTKVVFGEGNPSAKIMLLGEAPGEDEDLQGVPFIGKAGKKLDSILSFLGVRREDIYIANSVLCRPPLNRNPTRQELDACKWRLDLQIKLIKPELIVVLGKIAYEQLSGSPLKGALSQVFPENVKDGWINYKVGDHECKVVVTYHPSYHLRSPDKAYNITLPHWIKVKEWISKNVQTKNTV